MKTNHSVLGPGWPVFLFLLFATLPNTFTTTLLSPGLPLLALELGGGTLGVSRAQMLMTIPGVAMLASPFIGMLADRWGKRPILLSALFMDTVAGLGSMMTTDFASLLVLRFILGLGVGALMTVSLSMIGDYYAGEGRTKMLGYRWAAMTFFSLLAVQAAGFIVTGYGWAAPMWLYLVGIPLFIFALLQVNPPKPATEDSVEEKSYQQPLRQTINHVFILAMLGNIFLAIAQYNMYTQMPFLLREKGFDDPRIFSMIALPAAAVAVGSSFFFIRLRRWMHPLAIIALALALFSAGTTLFVFANNIPLLMVASAISGGSVIMFEPALSSFLLERIHPSRRAMAMGGIFSTFHVGPFLIPLIFSPINSAYGFNMSFALLAGAALLGALTLLAGLKGQIRQAAASDAPAR